MVGGPERFDSSVADTFLLESLTKGIVYEEEEY